MKKASTFLLFLSIMIIILTQSCVNKTDVALESKDSFTIYVPKDTVAIYLTSVKRNDGHGNYSHHLAMFDGNGNCSIDSLTTVYTYNKARSGNIQWIRVVNSGIKKIVEIKSAEHKPVIFRDSVYQHPHGVWNLNIPAGITIPPGGILEKYIITYILKETNDTITIDPYLRIPD